MAFTISLQATGNASPVPLIKHLFNALLNALPGGSSIRREDAGMRCLARGWDLSRYERGSRDEQEAPFGSLKKSERIPGPFP